MGLYGFTGGERLRQGSENEGEECRVSATFPRFRGQTLEPGQAKRDPAGGHPSDSRRWRRPLTCHCVPARGGKGGVERKGLRPTTIAH